MHIRKQTRKVITIIVTIAIPITQIYNNSISNNNNNSIQFFIIYVPSQQLQGQLRTQHSVDKSSYIKEKLNIKSKD
jgi:hypothetical protein